MNPNQTVEEIASTFRWIRTPEARGYLDAMLRFNWSGDENETLDPQEKIRRNFQETVSLFDGYGRIYWISRDMGRLIEHAAKSMPDEIFEMTDIPALSGVAILERPWRISILPEGRGGEMDGDLHGWAWRASEYRDPKSRDRRARGVLLGTLVGTKLAPTMKDWMEFGSAPLGDLDAELQAPDDFYRRVGARTAWRILQQSISRAERIRPDRATRRRLVKSDLPEPELIVVTLRRLKNRAGEDAPAGAQWSHRWIVSGHWRNQPFGPSMRHHRIQWISAYVKGPEEKPLVVKPRIYALTR